MGREIKRVPLDFDWPLKTVWSGFLMPEELHLPTCQSCGGEGTTIAARYLNCIAHLINLVGEAGVDDRPLHPWLAEIPLGPGVKPGPDAAELSAGLAGRSPRDPFGHDAIDRWRTTQKIVEAAGLPETWGQCPACNGRGEVGTDEQRAAYEAWQPSEPPTGEGWQLWETTSEGSPISPVFATADELAVWMSRNPSGFAGSIPSLEAARAFVTAGWAPSMVGANGKIADGITALSPRDDEQSGDEA
ncbi:hypothetical protein [Microbispora sp. CA-102843]|uniref:hypothetical protein n=1 Tax=Microbispora sp. CA-102843 TaxID=3239952 RepID=UPI003D8CAFE6